MNPPSARRLLLAGAMTGLVLVGGAGAAYAASDDRSGADPGPSGYAVVVDDDAASPAAADGVTPDRTCPYTPIHIIIEGADA